MKKYLKHSLYLIGALTIILLGTGDGVWSAVAISLWLWIFLFFASLAVVVASFSLVHLIKHGNPFIQDQMEPQYHIVRRPEEKPSNKKLCPVCKIPTRCSVKRSAAGYWLHVLRK